MKDHKAPGPDGFSACFFKSCWEIVGKDFKEAISNFFNKTKLMIGINSTFLCLIPNKTNAELVADYRPIACCNVIYKCITKILALRMKRVMNELISINQAAFLKDRSILDNIMLTHELLRNYHRSYISPRCAVKIDLQKAYDNVRWDTVIRFLEMLGFPNVFTQWVQACITTPMFSVLVNGSPVGFLEGKKGLRQGDPLSPTLFVIVMEAFTRMLVRQVELRNLMLHPKCSIPQVVSLCFADDFMVFTKPTTQSIECVKETMNKFHSISGLKANLSKSYIMMGGVNTAEAQEIATHLGFSLQNSQLSYLGIPMITSRLKKADCYPLIERLTSRMQSWKVKYLSYAGKLVLVNSVLFAIQVYWSRIMILPRQVIYRVIAISCKFLWGGPEMSKKVTPAGWKKIAKPKDKGGLGIIDIKTWNRAACCAHLVRIANRDSSVWVQWIWTHKLKKLNLWTMNIPNECSWIWRSILKCRHYC